MKSCTSNQENSINATKKVKDVKNLKINFTKDEKPHYFYTSIPTNIHILFLTYFLAFYLIESKRKDKNIFGLSKYIWMLEKNTQSCQFGSFKIQTN